MSRHSLQIRPSDCGGYGHVNNAIYVSYFQQALADCQPFQAYQENWRA